MKVDKKGLENISASELASLNLRREEAPAIWVTFQSAAGKKYTAVHVAENSSGPYILLTSEDKDRDDFKKVVKIMTDPMGSVPENNITDRGHDLCEVLRLTKLSIGKYFNQCIAERVDAFYAKSFTDVVISNVFLNLPLKVVLAVNGTIFIYPHWEYPKLKSSILTAETAFEKMDLGGDGEIVVRGDNKDWKERMIVLLEARFGPQRVRGEVAAT